MDMHVETGKIRLTEEEEEESSVGKNLTSPEDQGTGSLRYDGAAYVSGRAMVSRDLHVLQRQMR